MTVPKKRKRPPRESPKHKQAFEVWYAMGRNCLQAAKTLGVHENSIYAWRDRFRWDDRADLRDAALLAAMERGALSRRLKMQERHREALQILFQRALERLGIPFESEAVAVAALEKAIKLERELEGLPTWVMEVALADDETVLKMAKLAAEKLGLLGPMDTGGEAEEPEASAREKQP